MKISSYGTVYKKVMSWYIENTNYTNKSRFIMQKKFTLIGIIFILSDSRNIFVSNMLVCAAQATGEMHVYIVYRL